MVGESDAVLARGFAGCISRPVGSDQFDAELLQLISGR
jgi:hypothetical protein